MDYKYMVGGIHNHTSVVLYPLGKNFSTVQISIQFFRRDDQDKPTVYLGWTGVSMVGAETMEKFRVGMQVASMLSRRPEIPSEKMVKVVMQIVEVAKTYVDDMAEGLVSNAGVDKPSE